MTWNKEKITEFNKTAERCEAFVLLYNETAKIYKRLNLTLSFVTIVGSYLLGSAGIPINLFDPDVARVVNIVIQILVVVLGVIGTIHKVVDLTEKVSKYELLAFRYAKLSVVIRKELSKDNATKLDFNEFYEIVVDTETELKKDQMSIPDFIYNRYNRKMNTKALPYADLFLTEIKIVDVSVSADKMKNLDKYI